MSWAVDHVGFTVPDLDEAIAFFSDVVGAQLVFRAGPYEHVGYRWPDEAQPEPAKLTLAILRLGESHNIEFLEYAECASNPRPAPARPSEQYAGHLALYVDDVAGAADRFRDHGGQILGEVIEEQEGPLTGLEWVYALTPWGMVVELIRWPRGMPYERTTTARLAEPPALRGSSG